MSDPEFNRTIVGDCRATLRGLPDALFQCCVTSPPYWGLRDYGHPDQLGMDATPQGYVGALVAVFADVRRVLREDGTLWLNLGDSYASSAGGGQGKKSALADRRAATAGVRETSATKIAGGLKPKDLCGIPWRVALALQEDGWYLRSDIIWANPNPMPESIADRPTKAHEYLFLLAKSERYFYDGDAIKERAVEASRTVDKRHVKKSNLAPKDLQHTVPRGVLTVKQTRNARTVWTIASQPYDGAHFATMPPRLAERCILAGSAIGTAVLDPFMGSGTVGMVAESLGRRWLGLELNGEYLQLINARTAQAGLPFAEGSR